MVEGGQDCKVTEDSRLNSASIGAFLDPQNRMATPAEVLGFPSLSPIWSSSFGSVQHHTGFPMGHKYLRVSDTNVLNPERSRSSRKNMGRTNAVLNIFMATIYRSIYSRCQKARSQSLAFRSEGRVGRTMSGCESWVLLDVNTKE